MIGGIQRHKSDYTQLVWVCQSFLKKRENISAFLGTFAKNRLFGSASIPHPLQCKLGLTLAGNVQVGIG